MVWLEAIVSLTTRVAWSWWQFARRDVIFVSPSPCVLCCFLIDVESCLCPLFAMIYIGYSSGREPSNQRWKGRSDDWAAWTAAPGDQWTCPIAEADRRDPVFLVFFLGFFRQSWRDGLAVLFKTDFRNDISETNQFLTQRVEGIVWWRVFVSQLDNYVPTHLWSLFWLIDVESNDFVWRLVQDLGCHKGRDRLHTLLFSLFRLSRGWADFKNPGLDDRKDQAEVESVVTSWHIF